MNFTPFLLLIKKLNIQNGDIILVSSNIIKLFKLLMDNENITDPNYIIDTLQETIGNEGTLLFPTYNWDFCRGIAFDYYNTPSMTGSLSKVALKRNDFKRTKHPIYSFAVCGKYQDYLYSLDNTDSFGNDSPFHFLYEKHGKNLLVDIDYQNSFTFLHYVEESIGVNYRYIKQFTADYINEHHVIENKTFSMYVRNLELETKNNLNPIGKVFEEQSIAIKYVINDIPFIVIDLFESFDIIKNDIINNSAKKLVVHNGNNYDCH